MTTRAETVEGQELITAPVDLNGDKIDALLAAAEKLDALGAALDKFRGFVLKRALPGDFVSFKGEDGKEYLSLVGPAIDRVASSIGVSFVDWESDKLTDSDEKGKYYTWWYRCTTVWQGRRLECVEGRASSRDKFFGMVRGELRELSDVNEGDVRTAARRNCMKEGVNLMLGLRRIPKDAAVKMGLPVDNIRAVDFGVGASNKGTEPRAAGTPVMLVKYDAKEKEYKSGDKKGQKYTLWRFTDDAGAYYETTFEKVAQQAITFVEKKAKVALVWEKGQYGNRLNGVKEATAEAAAGQAAGAA